MKSRCCLCNSPVLAICLASPRDLSCPHFTPRCRSAMGLPLSRGSLASLRPMAYAAWPRCHRLPPMRSRGAMVWVGQGNPLTCPSCAVPCTPPTRMWGTAQRPPLSRRPLRGGAARGTRGAHCTAVQEPHRHKRPWRVAHGSRTGRRDYLASPPAFIMAALTPTQYRATRTSTTTASTYLLTPQIFRL